MGFMFVCLVYIFCGLILFLYDLYVYVVVILMRSLVAVIIGLFIAAYVIDGCVIGFGGVSFVGVV